MNPLLEHVKPLIGGQVVVDVAAPFVYLGQLQGADASFLWLVDADVHDLRDSDCTRDVYVLRSRLDGIRRNRKTVAIRMDTVLSISLLQDVVDH